MTTDEKQLCELDALREQAEFWRQAAEQDAFYQSQALGRLLRLQHLIRDIERGVAAPAIECECDDPVSPLHGPECPIPNEALHTGG